MEKLATSDKTLVGPELFGEMKQTFDFYPVTWTMMRYNKGMTVERADYLLDAFLQWFTLILCHREGQIVMFETPVEEAFHSFVLNTKPYHDFCNKFLGYFFHHVPLRDEREEETREAANYTVFLMEKLFGDSLHPELKKWRVEFDAGTYKVACVKCK